MLSSGSNFPKDDLINCLRSKGQGKEEFLKEMKKLNIEWIYEMIKYCCNILFEGKELPETKLEALLLVRDMFQSSQVPCVNLIEIYILPIIYEFAIFKPQEKSNKRGAFFFHSNGYSARLPNIQENGVKFVNLCTELVYFGSIVKPKRTFENEVLSQISEFTEYYEKLKKYGIEGTPKSEKDLKVFTQKSAKNANSKFIKNLQTFHNYCEDYSEYFVFKMMDSLQTEQNPLFSSAGKTVSSVHIDLDMRKILKQGDGYITSPLLQEISEGLKTAQNFIVKKNFLSLLSDFVKWADIQSFVQICYDETLDSIAPRIAQVNGQKGLNQGEGIYPQIKGQREAKKKFYIQFLKCLQIWAKCISADLQDEEEPSKVQQFYEFFKIERKFVFPENLMANKIQSEFAKCMEYNAQRNKKILEKLNADQTSLVNSKKSRNREALKSSHVVKEKNKQMTFEQINRNFENCFECFITLCDDEGEVDAKMKELIKFTNNFDNDLQNVEEDDNRPFEEYEELLDNGDDLIERVKEVDKIYKNYKKKKISFDEFQEEFEAILEEMEEDDEDEQGDVETSNNVSSKNDKSASISRRSLRKKGTIESSDKVISSYSPLIPSDIAVSEANHQKSIKNAKIAQKKEKGSSVSVSKKLKSKKQSQLKKLKVKDSIEPSAKDHSQIAQKIKGYDISNFDENPYYETSNNQRISKLSKLENKSINSGKSSLRERLRNRRSEMSEKSQKEMSEVSKKSYRDSNLVKNSQEMNSCSEYMLRREVDPEKINSSLKDKIANHRSSRFSGLSDKKSSLLKSVRKSRNQKSGMGYQKKDGVKEFDPSQQVLTEQVNEDYRLIPVVHEIQKDQTGLQKPLKQSRLKNSTLSKKSLIKSRVEKSSSILKSNRKSSRSSAVSKKSSEADYTGRENQKIKNQNVDEYMMKNSRKDFSQRSKQKIQLNSKRPLSSRLKQGDQSHSGSYSNISMIQSIHHKRPQTSSANVLPASEDFQDYYQMRKERGNDDEIKQPEFKPTENSYYGIEEIESRVKKGNKLEFKKCFDFQKEVIPAGKKDVQVIRGITEEGLMRRGRSAHESSVISGVNINKNPQEEYLMMKLKREHEREDNSELKKIQSRILKLKTETSKIRTELTSRSQDNRQFSLSRRSHSGASSREFCSFSSSKNSRNSSYNSIKDKSNISRSSNISVQGQILNTKTFDRHYCEIKDENVKKSFLRAKALLLKNQNIEVGSIFRRERNNLKIMVYLTPAVDISNLQVTMSKQPNLDIQMFPQTFPEIPCGKQVKFTVSVEVKNSPYNIPMMFINFTKGGRDREQKSYHVYLPCPIHKFIEFHPVRDNQEFLNKFQSLDESVIKTEEFKLSRRVGKLGHFQQYFPRLTTVMLNGNMTKYGAQCTFKKQRFLIMFSTYKPQSMVIQGVPLTRPQFLQYLLGFLKHIFTMEH